jgi:hypothetical protein
MAATLDLVNRLLEKGDTIRAPDVDPQRRRGAGCATGGLNGCPAQGRVRADDEVSYNCSSLPKLSFPKFNGENPRIWVDKCHDYFRIFNIPECLWTTAASLHMDDNAAKWLQVYKMKLGLGAWDVFVTAVDEKFGAYDYRKAMQDLLNLKQEGSVDEYTKEFEATQFQVSMFNPGLDDMFFYIPLCKWFEGRNQGCGAVPNTRFNGQS